MTAPRFSSTSSPFVVHHAVRLNRFRIEFTEICMPDEGQRSQLRLDSAWQWSDALHQGLGLRRVGGR